MCNAKTKDRGIDDSHSRKGTAKGCLGTRMNMGTWRARKWVFRQMSTHLLKGCSWMIHMEGLPPVTQKTLHGLLIWSTASPC